MKTADVAILLQRGRERSPDAKPRIISDNGPQFVARDVRAFVRESGITHLRPAPYGPQANGKIERLPQDPQGHHDPAARPRSFD